MSFVLLYWRECLLAILAGSCFFAVRSCESAHDKVVQIQIEDRALADQAKAQADEQKRKDNEDYANAQHDFEKQISDLAADHRIASVQCVRNTAPRSSPVPAAPSAPAGAVAEVAPNVSQPSTFDPGPAIDALTRECDRLAVAHNELVDWIMATR